MYKNVEIKPNNGPDLCILHGADSRKRDEDIHFIICMARVGPCE